MFDILSKKMKKKSLVALHRHVGRRKIAGQVNGSHNATTENHSHPLK